MGRVKLTPEQAKELLFDGEVIHAFTNNLIGADWRPEEVFDHINLFSNHIELAGPKACSLDHAIMCGGYFFQTKKDQWKKFDPEQTHEI